MSALVAGGVEWLTEVLSTDVRWIWFEDARMPYVTALDLVVFVRSGVVSSRLKKAGEC